MFALLDFFNNFAQNVDVTNYQITFIMKLNKLFYLLVAVSAIFVACGNDETTETPKPAETVTGTLTVFDKAADVAFWGGTCEILFKIDGGEKYAVPTVTTTAEWVNNIAVVDVIAFNVDRNETTEPRVATLKVTYGSQSVDVFVRQDAGWSVDVEFAAGALNGKYYGTKYSLDPNYFIILSTYGTTGDTDLPFVQSYYRLDMFSKTPAGNPVILPQGVYTYDMYASGAGDSFGGSYSILFETFENGTFADTSIEDGVIIVTENKVEAYLMIANKVHHVVYEGSLEVGWLKFPEPDYYSTLTSDFTFNEIGGKLRLVNYGDYYDLGVNNVSVSMISGDEMNGPYFMLDVVTDNTNNGVAGVLGTYTVAATEEELTKNTYLAGKMDGTQYIGSWYMNIAGGYVDHSNRAPIKSGTITIAQDGNTYIVTYDCVDDLGHKIQGTYSCASVEEYSGQ